MLRVNAFRLAAAVGLACTGLHLLDVASPDAEVPVVSRVEHAAQDWALTRLRGPRRPSGRVVVVAVDERSIEREGRWPWSHAKMARLLDELARGGASAVGFDVVWSEEDLAGRRLAEVAAELRRQADGSAGADARRRLGAVLRVASRGADPRFPPDVEPTERLASAIERAGNVAVGFMFLTGPDARPEDLAPRLEKLRFLRAGPIHVYRRGRIEPAEPDAAACPRAAGLAFPGVETPLDAVLAVADAGGFFNAAPDRDGTIRRYPAVASAGGVVFPSLGLATLSKALGARGVPAPVVPVMGEDGSGLLAVQVGGRSLETDRAGRVTLNYTGSYRDFPTWSAADVLSGGVSAEAIRGKIALVGNTAAGTWDQRVTPFDEFAPGVATHATFVENALGGELLRRGPPVVAAELAAMLALSVALAWLFARVRPAGAVAALLGGLGAWGAAAVLLLRERDVLVALGLPPLQMVGMFLAATTHRFFTEEREKRRARETFGRFLAPAIVEEVLGREGALRLGGEKRELTVLFSDIRGFTGIAERLDPHVLIEVLNEYLAPMTEIVVSEHSGTLDKYIGDAIMAFWGAPKEQPDHPLRACRAALRMLEKLEELRPRWRAADLPDVEVGIGINTGLMSVGFVGSQDRFYNYTVLGDAVNLASRLEGANKEYGTRILVSAATLERVRDQVVSREVDAVRVKGKREPVVVHELLGLAPAGAGQRAFLSEFERGLAAWKARRWEEAMGHFRAADAARGGDGCSRAYLARCEAMRREPPGPEWDGVYQLRTK